MGHWLAEAVVCHKRHRQGYPALVVMLMCWILLLSRLEGVGYLLLLAVEAAVVFFAPVQQELIGLQGGENAYSLDSAKPSAVRGRGASLQNSGYGQGGYG